MEKLYAFGKKKKKEKKIKTLQTSQQRTLISVEMDTSTHFMYYNVGKYMK